MFNLRKSLTILGLGLGLLVPSMCWADWRPESYGHFPDRGVAEQVAGIINGGTATGWRNARIQQDNVTRAFVVSAEKFYADANNGGGGGASITGQLTKGDPKDRLRLNMHAKTYQMQMTAGKTYTLDLTSGDGRSGPHNPGFFDTWLRLEDAQGNIADQNDDGGENYNSRVTYRCTRTGTYTIVVTSYASNVTGSFALRVAD